MRFYKNKKGFTLVEMILYVSVCSILLLTISTYLSFLLGARIRSQAITEVNQQGFRAMNLVALTVRNGRSIEVPVVGATTTTLSLTTKDALLNPTVFDVASGTLRITEGAGQPVPLTNSRVVISNLFFQNLSSTSSAERIIRISFTLDYKNLSGKDEYAFTKTFTESATMRR
jgi:type II secretory pathway pseudopilin PulG